MKAPEMMVLSSLRTLTDLFVITTCSYELNDYYMINITCSDIIMHAY